MKIVPIDIIKSMSGKVCQHSDTSIALNKTSGLMHTSKMCNPYEGPASAKQIAQQEAFKVKTGLVSAWLLANRPSATNGEKGTEAYRKALSLKKQMGLSNVRQVVSKYIDATGKVTLPDGVTASVPTGGNTSEGGSSSGSGGEAGGGTF